MEIKVNQYKCKHVGRTDTIIIRALERNINCTEKPERIFKNVRRKFPPFNIYSNTNTEHAQQ